MKKGKLNIIMVAAALIALGGCSTVPVKQLNEQYDRPILSAAEARSMIRVEVTMLEPQPEEPTILAAASFDRL